MRRQLLQGVRPGVRTYLAAAVALVSVLVVAIVARSLSLPAITLGDEPTCGLVEHAHTSDCYDFDGNLICTLPEHEHSDACYTENGPEEPDEADAPGETGEGTADPSSEDLPDSVAPIELTSTGNDYAVSVTYGAEAELPEDTTISVRELDSESEEYTEHLAQTLEAANIPTDEADDYAVRFFDITLLCGETPVEPAAAVQVTIACDEVPAEEDEVFVVHFADEGVELIEPELAPEAAADTNLATAYTFSQGSFSVSGLAVRGRKLVDASDTVPMGTMLAKKRSLSELEAGGTYLIYCVYGNSSEGNATPYAIGKDGTLHQLQRTKDGNNIYTLDRSDISDDWLWTMGEPSEVSDGMVAHFANVGDHSIELYPQSSGAVVRSGTGGRVYLQKDTESQFYIYDEAQSARVYSSTADNLQAVAATSTSKRYYYFAEVPTTYSEPASLVRNNAEILEGYYVISRSGGVSAGATGVITVDYDLSWNTDAVGVASGEIQGFLNSEIWYVKPKGGGTYTVQNVFSGEFLSPNRGTTTDTITFDYVNGSGNSYHITSSAGQGLDRNSGSTYSQWGGTASYWLYRVHDNVFKHAYFDTGVGGNGGSNGFYQGIIGSFQNHIQYQLDENVDGRPSHVITLPSAAEVGTTGVGSNRVYKYQLQGWYEVYGEGDEASKYHQPEEQVRVYDNAVFYADWVPVSYNIGQPENLSSKVVYSPAITTTLFDYNELFNAQYAQLTSTAADNVSFLGHTESWYDQTPNDEFAIAPGSAQSFMFVYNHAIDGTGLADVYERVFQNRSNSKGSGNGNYNGAVNAGILAAHDLPAGGNDLISQLFDEGRAVTGKTYVGYDHYLYSYDWDTGYYYYDSNRNAASYNRGANRFYVYTYTNRTNKSGLPNVDTYSDKTDFLPLNYGDDTFYEEKAEVNYWFGMKTEFNFFLPNDADPTGGVNKSIFNEDLAFRFSGDDDVWVLVDDELVLDLGGIHGTVYGEINFSNCTTTVGQEGAGAIYELKGGGTVTNANLYSGTSGVTDDQLKIIGATGVTPTPNSILAGLEAGNHKLTLLYLERGSSESNAAIYFNIAPVYQLRMSKVDDATGAAIDGATFKLYTEPSCSDEYEAFNVKPMSSQGIVTSYDVAGGYSGTGGVFYLDGLVANQDYYLKEVTTPAGYRTPSGPFRLRIDGGVMSVYRRVTDAGGTETETLLQQYPVQDGYGFTGSYGGFVIDIPNYSGREIPAAGGSGTAGLRLAGAVLAVLAAVALVMRKRRLRLIGSSLLVGLLTLLLAMPLGGVGRAYAAETGAASGSISVQFEAEGMPFALYRVGEASRSGGELTLTPVAETADLGIDWGALTTGESLDELTQVLAGVAGAGGLTPVGEAEVASGTARFADVEEGLYLVLGGTVEYGGYMWSALPSLVSVPDLYGAEGWNVSVAPKQSKAPLPAGDEPDVVEYLLVKQWVGDTAAVRPGSIRVVLSRGGEPVETLTLDASNNWSYRWVAADDGVPWTAAEPDAPSGYTWAVAADGTRITLRNTYQGKPPAMPTGSLTQTGDDSLATGVVVGLAALGAALLVVGFVARRAKRWVRCVAAAGLCAMVASGILLWQGFDAEHAATQALTTATSELLRLIPEPNSTGAAEPAAPVPVLAVDGTDFVGYLAFDGLEAPIAVQSSSTDAELSGTRLLSGDPRAAGASIAGIDLDSALTHIGEALTFVDVDGHAYHYLIDHIATEGEDLSTAFSLAVNGETSPLTLVCVPAGGSLSGGD